ncbi:primosomal protein N' [Helicobacter mesocricetorum]|uniref:primosomal protein N' n=1 Tax=Helicobacter mesocricetorum TaxID=87012 RepID=UPI000CF1BBCC|nr:primosomal protein N' [Helicobacter mesocricetorum]
MFYYLIALFKQKSPPLTYESIAPLNIGEVVEVPLLKRNLRGVVLKAIPKPNFECKPLKPLKEYFSPSQFQLAEFIASYYCSSYASSFGIFMPFMQDSIQDFPSLSFEVKPLNEEQTQALNFINSRQSSLLFGDTGSGKTEIYIHLLNQTLQKGKNAIFLMPEIALTPQMEKRLKAVFGECIAFWHSKVTKSKKQAILQKLKQGEIRILAGSRSSFFLPLSKIGLIIVDEEHDDAYKSSSSPRLNTRDIALFLAQKNHIKILLGSATPSLNIYYKALQKQNIFRLKGSFYKSQKEFIFCESHDYFHPLIIDNLAKNLADNKQAIVFLPTRANFKHLLCSHCGETIQCPYCSVSMSLHKKDSSLKCHYCHFTSPILSTCPTCGGDLQSLRIGTQEFAKELSTYLPNAKIACFDRDSITTQKQLTQTLESFNQHKIDILVGTQMLTKGHDYHNVALSIALGLDYLLKGSDYRAREKTLALMVQLAGRSGRKENGKVIVQTLQKDFFQRYLQDYEEFLKNELKMRKNLYPPFVRLALIKISHKDKEKAHLLMQKTLKALPPHKKVEIVGYGDAPIEKIANKWRCVILLRSLESKALHFVLKSLEGFACEIDIDPLDFN